MTERDHVPVGVAGLAPRYADQFPRPWGSAENVLPGIGAEGLPGGLPSLLRLTMPGRM